MVDDIQQSWRNIIERNIIVYKKHNRKVECVYQRKVEYVYQRIGISIKGRICISKTIYNTDAFFELYETS